MNYKIITKKVYVISPWVQFQEALNFTTDGLLGDAWCRFKQVSVNTPLIFRLHLSMLDELNNYTLVPARITTLLLLLLSD